MWKRAAKRGSGDDDDDDFEEIVSAGKRVGSSSVKVSSGRRRSTSGRSPLGPSNGANLSSKKAKVWFSGFGKENGDCSTEIVLLDDVASISVSQESGLVPEVEEARLEDSDNLESKNYLVLSESEVAACPDQSPVQESCLDLRVLRGDRLLELCSGNGKSENTSEEFEAGTQLKELMDLCWDVDGGVILDSRESVRALDADVISVDCPSCGVDITDLGEDLRLEHTNLCLDREEREKADSSLDQRDSSLKKASVDVAPVVEWLKTLGLSRYEEIFIREEIDWEALQCLTEEDFLNLGISALGPRKKIVHALHCMREGETSEGNPRAGTPILKACEKANQYGGNKLITEFFGVPRSVKSKSQTAPITRPAHGMVKGSKKVETAKKPTGRRAYKSNCRQRDVPSWCCIPGTPFRVDAFCYTRGDCVHWFLTHFHLDHYQGLTRNFHNGKIYCSSVTAHLLNTKIGVAWSILHVLPLNERITISGVGVTCVDANHCPGSIIVLFEPPNGKPVLHTGDFRYCKDLGRSPILASRSIHTLILDTTYCNPQYDFPRQESVIQFVVEAIQAEAFNPSSLFLIGSYTIVQEKKGYFWKLPGFLRRRFTWVLQN
ncbi:uncharacterized protein LOC144710872 isoform X2 [Wolffia australiana]